MKKSFTLFLILSTFCFAQTVGWQNISPSPPYSTFEDVFFLNADIGWAVADYGIIIKTVDGGINWIDQSSGTTNHLFSVFFKDKNNGWIVGDVGVILHTTDGGNNWNSQSSGTANRLYDIFFFENNIGWAVGAGGEILKTSNAGVNWSGQSSGTFNWLLSVHFITQNRGWAAGYFGTIVHTLDGGTNWSTQNSNTSTFLTSVQFAHWQNGWAFGTAGTVLKTSDGGTNWNIINAGISEDLFSSFFIDRYNGWTVGSNGAIYNTVDGGDNWYPQASGITEILFSVHFVHPDTGWAVGGSGTILKTTDGGNSENKIYGFAQYGSTPIENVEIRLRKKENYWTNFDNTQSSQNGYYEFNAIPTGTYHVYPLLQNTGYWTYGIYNGSGRWKNTNILFEENDLVRMDFRLYKKINLNLPDEDIEILPLQVDWDPLTGADHYRIYLDKQGIYCYYHFYNSGILAGTSFTIDGISESGYICLRVQAYDSNDKLIGYTSKYFYLLNNNSVVSGTISTNTVWDGFILVKGDITVENGVTLTILPGTTVFFDTLDTGGNPGKFGINNHGTIIANGTAREIIDFTSYYTEWNAHAMNWNGITIANNANNNSFQFTRFHESDLALNIVNSNTAVINSRFYNNGAAINLDVSNVNFSRCYFSNHRANESYIKIQNSANPTFFECNFANYYGGGNYFIELINTSNNITAQNCHWSVESSIDDRIFDKNDDPSLGQVIYQPVLSDFINISVGAENVSMQSNAILNNKIKKQSDNILSVLGVPDQKEYFLNVGNSLILDMGPGGEIVNGDSSDIIIFAKNYKTQDTSIVFIDVSLSNDTTGFWESIGIIMEVSSFDISQLSQNNYRYVKISNYSNLPSSVDSVGCFIDAVVSIHDSLVATTINEPVFKQIPDAFSLSQNYPNPFNPYTNISFSLPKTTNVKIEVFNILGQRVATLVDNKIQTGNHILTFDGSQLASGLYFYTIKADKFYQVRKMLLMK